MFWNKQVCGHSQKSNELLCRLHCIGKSSILAIISLAHLLLWESSLVSLEPLEVGELHFQVWAQTGLSLFQEAPIRCLHFFCCLQLSTGFPLFTVPHLSQENLWLHLTLTVTFYWLMGASSQNGGPLAPHSEKAPRAPFPFSTLSQETCWTPLTPRNLFSSVRGRGLNLTDDDSRPRRLCPPALASFYVGGSSKCTLWPSV